MVKVESHNRDDDFHVTVENNMEGFKTGAKRVTEQLIAWDAGDRARYIVELALDEMLTNIIRYAYTDSNVHTIDISMSSRDGDITLVLEDEGRPFDPIAAKPLAQTDDISEATIGGRGLLMVRKLVSSMRYENRHGCNHLELVIKNEP